MFSGFFTQHVPNKEKHHAVSLLSNEDEHRRTTALLDAHSRTTKLFADIESTLVRPGITEAALGAQIKSLAAQQGYADRGWDRLVVRSGPNTALPPGERGADRTVLEGDIVCVDVGPVVVGSEAGFARTYVLGDDPVKTKVRDAAESVWAQAKAFFDAEPQVTGERLYEHVCGLAREVGYEFVGVHAGHVVGDDPDGQITKDNAVVYIARGNDHKMRGIGHDGKQKHWSLEVRLVDKEHQIGGVYGQLLM